MGSHESRLHFRAGALTVRGQRLQFSQVKANEMSTSDDGVDLEAYFRAAGFDGTRPPVTMLGELEATLSVKELRRRLGLLDLEDMLPDPRAHAHAPDAEKVRNLATRAFDAHDFRRVYSGYDGTGSLGPTSLGKERTLIISFGGLAYGMGNVGMYEFVGVCERIGASALFVRGVFADASCS